MKLIKATGIVDSKIALRLNWPKNEGSNFFTTISQRQKKTTLFLAYEFELFFSVIFTNINYQQVFKSGLIVQITIDDNGTCIIFDFMTSLIPKIPISQRSVLIYFSSWGGGGINLLVQGICRRDQRLRV